MTNVREFIFPQITPLTKSNFSEAVTLTGDMTIVGFDIPDSTVYKIQLLYTPPRPQPDVCDCLPTPVTPPPFLHIDAQCPQSCCCAPSDTIPWRLTRSQPTLAIRYYKGYTIRVVKDGVGDGVLTYTMEA